MHPLQSLTDILTIKETFAATHKPKIVLTWAPHVKPLPQCVANSFAQWINAWGESDFVITHPEHYELSEQYRQGISPSREELEKAVIETDRDSIGGANGVYCSGVAFVSDDLPAQAELYVRRHELEHAFQFRLQIVEQNYESAANYAAAKEYPVGMVETTIFSVIKARDHFDSTTCYIVTLWETFKIYFLPFGG